MSGVGSTGFPRGTFLEPRLFSWVRWIDAVRCEAKSGYTKGNPVAITDVAPQDVGGNLAHQFVSVSRVMGRALYSSTVMLLAQCEQCGHGMFFTE